MNIFFAKAKSGRWEFIHATSMAQARTAAEQLFKNEFCLLREATQREVTQLMQSHSLPVEGE